MSSLSILALPVIFFVLKWLMLGYVMPIKRIREKRVSAHLRHSFLFFKLSLEFGLDFEFGLGLTLLLELGLEFWLGLGLGLGLEWGFSYSYVT